MSQKTIAYLRPTKHIQHVQHLGSTSPYEAIGGGNDTMLPFVANAQREAQGFFRLRADAGFNAADPKLSDMVFAFQHYILQAMQGVPPDQTQSIQVDPSYKYLPNLGGFRTVEQAVSNSTNTAFCRDGILDSNTINALKQLLTYQNFNFIVVGSQYRPVSLMAKILGAKLICSLTDRNIEALLKLKRVFFVANVSDKAYVNICRAFVDILDVLRPNVPIPSSFDPTTTALCNTLRAMVSRGMGSVYWNSPTGARPQLLPTTINENNRASNRWSFINGATNPLRDPITQGNDERFAALVFVFQHYALLSEQRASITEHIDAFGRPLTTDIAGRNGVFSENDKRRIEGLIQSGFTKTTPTADPLNPLGKLAATKLLQIISWRELDNLMSYRIPQIVAGLSGIYQLPLILRCFSNVLEILDPVKASRCPSYAGFSMLATSLQADATASRNKDRGVNIDQRTLNTMTALMTKKSSSTPLVNIPITTFKRS